MSSPTEDTYFMFPLIESFLELLCGDEYLPCRTLIDFLKSTSWNIVTFKWGLMFGKRKTSQGAPSDESCGWPKSAGQDIITEWKSVVLCAVRLTYSTLHPNTVTRNRRTSLVSLPNSVQGLYVQSKCILRTFALLPSEMPHYLLIRQYIIHFNLFPTSRVFNANNIAMYTWKSGRTEWSWMQIYW